MTTLNKKQAQSYSIAQSLTRFLKQSNRIHSTFTPFHTEVNNLINYLKQIPALATTKKQTGTPITIQKKALKKEIAADIACLCNIVTVYALDTKDITLQYNVRHTYTDIFTLHDYAISVAATIITNTISPLLEKDDFLPYGITQHHLTSILEKATHYNSIRFKAKNINSNSQYASQNITTILKKVAAIISRMKRLLPHFQHTHPTFITSFHEALSPNQTSTRRNILQGTITNTSTGEPVEAATLTAEGKNKTAVTGSNGFYQLTGIKTGTHKLTIAAEGYIPQTVTVKVVRGKTITLNISLARKPLTLPKAEVA